MGSDLFITNFLVLVLGYIILETLFPIRKFEKKKNRWIWRIPRSVLTSILVYLVLAKWGLWPIAIFVGVIEFFLDWWINSSKARTEYKPILRMGIHLLIILSLTIYFFIQVKTIPVWVNWSSPNLWNFAVILSAGLLLANTGGTLIGSILLPLQKQLGEPSKGLENGGKYIGILERLLIFSFVLVNQFSGIGFLVAAKSIFRYSEIKKSNDRKEAEYIIIGTFTSFLFAMVISYLATKLLK